jgi:hypothetical protein
MSIVTLKNKSKILHGPKNNDSPLGFRLNSGARTTRYVGKESLVSRSSNITNCECVSADLTQPSVVNNREMINRKYKCFEKGITNKHWVKSVDEPENKSQGSYINNLSNVVTCATDNNNPSIYENHIICRPKQTNPIYTYTKTLYQPMSSSMRTIMFQRKCNNPSPDQMPIPGPVNVAGGIGGATRIGTGTGCS